MATIELTAGNFDDFLNREGTLLIDFWASWCGPCRFFGPIYERVSERHSDLSFGKIDTEAQPELAAAFQVRSIPTLVIIRDKVVLYAEPGALPEQALEELITKAQAVDMKEAIRNSGRRKRQSA